MKLLTSITVRSLFLDAGLPASQYTFYQRWLPAMKKATYKKRKWLHSIGRDYAYESKPVREFIRKEAQKNRKKKSRSKGT